MNYMKICYFTHQHLLIYWLITIICFGCSDQESRFVKNQLTENTIRGKALAFDFNESVVEVEVLGRSQNLAEKIPVKAGNRLSLQVQPGDLALLNNQEYFVGKLQESFSSSAGKTFLLYNVWPDDPAERIRVKNVNHTSEIEKASFNHELIQFDS